MDNQDHNMITFNKLINNRQLSSNLFSCSFALRESSKAEKLRKKKHIIQIMDQEMLKLEEELKNMFQLIYTH